MKVKYFSFAMGVLTGAVLFGGTAAYAAGILAEHAPQTAYVDGAPVQLEAYNIGGYNYVKLRDIGQAVGFNVYWNGQSVQIDSDAPYTGVAPGGAEHSSITLTDNMEVRMEMVRLINEVRRENSVPELPVNASLMDAAQAISNKLYTTHHSQEEVLTARNFGYPYGFKSNLAVFTGAAPAYIAQTAVRNWVNSPGHFQAMIDPKCDCIGVGITVSGNTAYCYMFAGVPNSSTMYG